MTSPHQPQTAREPRDLIQRIRSLSTPLKPIATGALDHLEPLPDIRAVLFDIYGTLLISGSGDIGTAAATAQATAMDESLKSSGFDVLPGAGATCVDLMAQAITSAHAERRASGIDYPEIDIRRILTTVIAQLHEQGLLSTTRVPVAIDRLAVEYECRVNPTWPMPGMSRALDRCAMAGIHLGIVSNAQFLTPLVLEALADRPYTAMGFDSALCAWSYQHLEAKPSEALFAAPLERLDRAHQITPTQVLYIGNDIRNDIRPASSLGCRTALFAGDQRSLRWRRDDPTCKGVVPDAVITSLDQLDQIIARI